MIPEEDAYYPIYDSTSLLHYALSEEGLKKNFGLILVNIAQSLEKFDYLNLPIVKRKAGLNNKILAWMNHTFCEIPVSVNADIFDVNQVTIKSYISEANQVMTHPSFAVPKGESIEQYFLFYLGLFNDWQFQTKLGNLCNLVEEAGRFDEFFEKQEEDDEGTSAPKDGFRAWYHKYCLPKLEFVSDCKIHTRGQRPNDICVHELNNVAIDPSEKMHVYHKSHLASINVKWNICEKNKRMRITPENDFEPTYVLVLDTHPIKTSQRLPSTYIRFGRIPDGEKAIMLRDIPVIPKEEIYILEATCHILDEMRRLQVEKRKKKGKRLYTSQRRFGEMNIVEVFFNAV